MIAQYTISVFLVFALLVGFAPLVGEAKDLNVPLSIKEAAGVERRYEVVSSGVPLPRSQNIINTKHLRVVDSHGKGVAAQFTVLARWGAKPSNKKAAIKWVLVEFPVKQLKANGNQTYHLKTGGKRPAIRNKVRVQQNTKQLTITTGKAKFIVDKQHFNIIDQVFVDQKALLSDKNGEGAVITAAGQDATSSEGTVEKIRVQRKGPIHTIVTVKGDHRTSGGVKLLAYTARLHFYANSSAVRVEYSVWNDEKMVNVNGQPDIKDFDSPNAIQFESLTLNSNVQQGHNPQFHMGGAQKETWDGDLTSEARLYQDSSGGPLWNDERNFAPNTFRGFHSSANGSTLHDACTDSQPSVECRALGWIDSSSSVGGLAVGVRHFWQNYPKALQVKKDGTVSVELFPSQYAENFILRVGEQKTHEVLMYFHPQQKGEKVKETMIAMNNPLRAWAPSSWYLNDTKVFHDSVPRNAQSFTQFEGYVDAAISHKNANLLDLPDGLHGKGWTYGEKPESLGWWAFGDRIAEDEAGSGAVFTNNQYDHTLAFVYQFVRSLDSGGNRAEDWWSLAEPTMRHQVDLDTIHSRCTGKSVSKMEVCMDPSTPVVVGWAMGSRLTNSWHSDPNPDAEQRHALIDVWAGGNTGLIYYYYLTGDILARDGFIEQGKNAAWKVENTPCNADSSKECAPGYGASSPDITYADWQRESAYLLEMNTKTFEATGQKRYLNAAQNIVRAMNPKGQWFADEDFVLNDNEPEGDTYTPWATAMMMKSLGFYLDVYKEHSGKVDPAAQDVLLQYAEITTKFWRVGDAEPSQYRIYSNGGYQGEEANPMNIAMADGLAWALEVDDGRLDRDKTENVLRDAFKTGSKPWGTYADNTFMTTKTHIMQMVNGWKSMKYLQANK